MPRVSRNMLTDPCSSWMNIKEKLTSLAGQQDHRFNHHLYIHTTMCYFDQVRWNCGYFKWGNFRQQCNKEYRTGETCGLKLVWDTDYKGVQCKLCDQMDKKQRRYDKMWQDVERWRKEGNRRATIEKTEYDMVEVQEAIHKIRLEHEEKLRSIG